jgi:hypothetical protein
MIESYIVGIAGDKLPKWLECLIVFDPVLDEPYFYQVMKKMFAALSSLASLLLSVLTLV